MRHFIELSGADAELKNLTANKNIVTFTAGCSTVKVSREQLRLLADTPATPIHPHMPSGWYRMPLKNYNPETRRWLWRSKKAPELGHTFLGDVNTLHTTKSTDEFPGCVLATSGTGTDPKGGKYCAYSSAAGYSHNLNACSFVIVALVHDDFEFPVR